VAVGNQTQTKNDCACNNNVKDKTSKYYTGLIEPDNWRDTARFDTAVLPLEGLPSSFDWRTETPGGLPPIRNQSKCGSCWAFATTGVLECNIKIKENKDVDLSEQWLLSCNQRDWGCWGGWVAHDYHLDLSHPDRSVDPCQNSGAVLEEDYPYVGLDTPCQCQNKPHEYFIDDWFFIESEYDIPSVSTLKSYILMYGPIWVAVRATLPFKNYTGGIFDVHDDGKINHAVVLVGWKDREGFKPGHWIMRNSWGPSWGEDGYMRIAYGTNSIGYAANYIKYEAEDHYLRSKYSLNFGRPVVRGTAKASFQITNDNPDPYHELSWKIDKSNEPSWGEWSYSQESGNSLRGIDGPTTIDVTVYVKKRVDSFEGHLRVYNVDNPDDEEFIYMALTTSRTKESSNSLFLKFFDNHPVISSLFPYLVNMFKQINE